jgi:hypothetical protein
MLAAWGAAWKVHDLRTAYRCPTGMSGSMLAVVELGGGWVAADIDAYFPSLGRPASSIADVSVDSSHSVGSWAATNITEGGTASSGYPRRFHSS